MTSFLSCHAVGKPGGLLRRSRLRLRLLSDGLRLRLVRLDVFRSSPLALHDQLPYLGERETDGCYAVGL